MALECPECHATFSKKQYLQRHSHLHKPGGGFACTDCQKIFSRSDSLQRHLKEHTPGQRRAHRTGRACVACVKARARCEPTQNNEPCSRCAAKGAECIPSGPRAKKSSSLAKMEDAKSEDDGSMSVSPSGSPEQEDMVAGVSRRIDQRQVDDIRASMSISPAGLSLSVPLAGPPRVDAATGSGSHLPFSSLATSSALGFANPSSAFDSLNKHESIPPERTALSQPQGDTLSLGPLDHLNFYDFLDFGTAFDWPVDQSFSAPRLEEAPAAPSAAFGLGDDPFKILLEGPPLSLLRLELVSRPASPVESLWVESKAPEQTLQQGGDQLAEVAYLSPAARRDRGVARLTQEGLNNLRNGVADFSRYSLYSDQPRNAEMALFPSVEVVDDCLQLYFEVLNIRYPIFHRVTFNPNKSSWILVAAMIALGGRSRSDAQGARWARALNEVVRRGLEYIAVREPASRTTKEYVQAMLLFVIHGAFSGDRSQFEWAENMRATCVTLGRRMRLFRRGGSSPNWSSTDDGELRDAWLRWVEKEEILRLGHSITVVESFFSVYFDLPAMMPSAELAGCCISPNTIWEAQTPQEWKLEGEFLGPDFVQNPLIFSTVRDCMNRTPLVLDSLQRMALYMLIGRMLLERHRYHHAEALFNGLTGLDNELLVSVSSMFVLPLEAEMLVKAIAATGVFGECTSVDEALIAHHVCLQQELPLYLVRIMGGKPNSTGRRDAKIAFRGWAANSPGAAQRSRKAVWHAAQIFRLVQNLVVAEAPLLVNITFDAALAAWAFCQLFPGGNDSQTTDDAVLVDYLNDYTSATQWAANGSDIPAISTVGRLSGPESAAAVLLAYRKLLGTRFPSWSFSSSMVQILEDLARQPASANE